MLPGVELLRLLGYGGQGRVWRVRRRSDGHVMALKVGGGPGDLARFEQARSVVGRVAGLPGVERLAVDELLRTADGTPALALELVPGRSLAEQVDHGSAGPLAVATWALELCRILERVHGRGLVHRDLTPGNVMASLTGAVTLVDFGLGRAPADPRLTAGVAGTPSYVPPEVYDGHEHDALGEVYAFGRLLGRLVDACSRSGAAGPGTDQTLAVALRRLADRAANLGREGRPASFAAIADELAVLLSARLAAVAGQAHSAAELAAASALARRAGLPAPDAQLADALERRAAAADAAGDLDCAIQALEAVQDLSCGAAGSARMARLLAERARRPRPPTFQDASSAHDDLRRAQLLLPDDIGLRDATAEAARRRALLALAESDMLPIAHMLPLAAELAEDAQRFDPGAFQADAMHLQAWDDACERLAEDGAPRVELLAAWQRHLALRPSGAPWPPALDALAVAAAQPTDDPDDPPPPPLEYVDTLPGPIDFGPGDRVVLARRPFPPGARVRVTGQGQVGPTQRTSTPKVFQWWCIFDVQVNGQTVQQVSRHDPHGGWLDPFHIGPLIATAGDDGTVEVVVRWSLCQVTGIGVGIPIRLERLEACLSG